MRSQLGILTCEAALLCGIQLSASKQADALVKQPAAVDECFKIVVTTCISCS